MDSEQHILQRNLAKYIVNEVFNTVTEEDILKMVNNVWTHKGNPLTEGQVKILKKDAKAFRDTGLYNVLCAEIRWHARKALNDAITENDIISAKMLAYFVDVLESKVKKIALL